eukprot:Rhum_TRINITY_DN19169_c0_g1::Rhum_TRINITY_DN19169_c0_g1_i1::g.169462::m.169462/K14544/UTP22, NOL6; U3 small nucleolar RNA-associated protein 22
MDSRDALNAKLFSLKLRHVLDAAKLQADPRIDDFLKPLRRMLVKEAPFQVRADKVTLTGAYLLGTAMEAEPAVDLYLTVPLSTCSGDDVRRHMWVEARESYLAGLCQYLRETHNLVAFVEDCPTHFNKKRIAITGPALESGGHWSIRLHAGLNSPPSLLSHFTHDVTLRRSPFYSQLVLEDSLTGRLHEALHASLGSSHVLADVCVLLNLWAEKQGLSSMPDGLTPTVIHSIVHHLVNTGNICDSTTTGQGFRLVLQFLATMPSVVDLKPLPTDQLRGDVHAATRALHEAHQASAAAVLLFEGWNVWHNCTEQAKEEIQAVARDAVKALDSASATDAVLTLFRIPSPFWLRFDSYVAVPFPKHVRTSYAAPDARHDSAYSVKRDFATLVHDLLEDALGDSVTRCRCKLFESHAVFGLGLKTTAGLKSRVVIGPTLIQRDSVEAFNKKWGGRAKNYQHNGEMRRAAVFSGAESDYEYVRALLTCLLRDLDVAPGIRVLGQGTTESIRVDKQGGGRFDAAEELKVPIRRALLDLSSFLQGLDNFPLQVVGVKGAHPALRDTAVAPPHPHSMCVRQSDPDVPEHLLGYGPTVEAMEVVLEFGVTSAWPDHKDAIDNIKSALHCKIAQRLRKERRLVCIPRRDCCDVLLNGFVFRLFLYHPREVMLLENLGLAPQAHMIRKQLFLLPQHHEFVQAYGRHHFYYTAAVRMLKKWAAVHFLGTYVNEETLELIMCKVFSKTPAPMSPLAAFVRALHLIESWDWAEVAMAVPAVAGSEQAVSRKRKDGPAMWFNTTYDSQHSVFTANTPNAVILKRLRRLAEATLVSYFNAMQSFDADETWEAKWKPLFTTSLQPFTMLITLYKDVVCNAHHNPSNKKVLGDAKDKQAYPQGYLFRPGCETRREELHKLINYNPVSWYIGQLRQNFREHALFAHDPYGGNIIAVVGTRKFTKEESELLAEHFQGMGSGIVKRVQVSHSLLAASKEKKAAAEASSPQQPAAKAPAAARKAAAAAAPAPSAADAEFLPPIGEFVEFDARKHSLPAAIAAGPVLAYFTATWCGPCQKVKPQVKEIASAAPHLRVLAIDVDENDELAAKHHVRSMPTFVLFDGAREVARKTGSAGLKKLDFSAYAKGAQGSAAPQRVTGKKRKEAPQAAPAAAAGGDDDDADDSDASHDALLKQHAEEAAECVRSSGAGAAKPKKKVVVKKAAGAKKRRLA